MDSHEELMAEELQDALLSAATPKRCNGDRCTSTDGAGHSRECLQEAGRSQGWEPTQEEMESAGPSKESTPVLDGRG